MQSQQECPSVAAWQAVLEGLGSDASSDDYSDHLRTCRQCQEVIEELTRGDRAWQEIAAELRGPGVLPPLACRRILDEMTKNAPALTPPKSSVEFHQNHLEERRPIMPACIHIERMMHRNNVAITADSAAGYALVKLIPSGLNGAVKPMGLNLALALDVSGSMYEEDGTGISRLKRVQDAATDAVKNLRPEDTLSIIAFAQNAKVLLPATPIAERDKIDDVIRRIDMFDVDPGGTAMDEGLALALGDIEQHAGAGKLSQIVMLTDGETSGEQRCRSLAQEAAAKKVPLTLMGVGLDWKASLIKDLANLSQGKWLYIDVNEAKETTRIFKEEFQTLAATGFLDVEMHLRPMKDVRIKRVRQVVPQIKEIALAENEGHVLVGRLGTLQHDASTRYVLDLSLPRRPDGKYILAQMEITYDLGTGKRESSGEIPLEMTYTASSQGHVNAEVMKHIDDIQLKELSDSLEIALQNNDKSAAKQVAEQIARKGEQMGERAVRKTMLVKQALDELNANGVVPRKTRIALDDAVRNAEVPT